MVFSSLPLYLDPPNWQQHLNQNPQQTNDDNENQHLLQQHQPPLLPPQPNGNHPGGGGNIDGGVGGSNSVNNANLMRSNSMAERARLAKIAQPDGPLKCPRCDSTNTKFCYFNNYSLTQPRHFCKTCRRYWTRGGALRSVPVGGGCRRNKRSKGINSSKSNTSSGASGNIIGTNNTTGAAGTNGGMIMSEKYNSSGPVDSLTGHLSSTPQLSFMASLQNITQLGMGNLGLNFPAGLQLDHQLANNRTSPSSNMDQFRTGTTSSGPFLSYLQQQQQQTHHQFPFMAGFHDQVTPPSAAAAAHGLYHQFQNEDVSVEANTSTYVGGGSQNNHELMMMMGSKSTISSPASQNAPVKMEENFHKKLLLGMSGADDQKNNNKNNYNQFWYNGNGGGAAGGGNNNATGNMWTDLSGLNSSSTTHLL